MIACSKAVRQYGEVKNGHKFKRPPSKKCVARYRAIAAAWLQTYSRHQIEGTLPADMHGAPPLSAELHLYLRSHSLDVA